MWGWGCVQLGGVGMCKHLSVKRDSETSQNV